MNIQPVSPDAQCEPVLSLHVESTNISDHSLTASTLQVGHDNMRLACRHRLQSRLYLLMSAKLLLVMLALSSCQAAKPLSTVSARPRIAFSREHSVICLDIHLRCAYRSWLSTGGHNGYLHEVCICSTTQPSSPCCANNSIKQ